MSSSTVAITANPAVNNSPSLALGSKPATRRRTVVVAEKKLNPEMVAEGGVISENCEAKGSGGKDLSHSIKGEAILERPKDLLQPNKSVNSAVLPRRSRKAVLKREKPWWNTVISVFAKNFLLLLVILGLVQMIRKLALKHEDNYGGPMGISDFEGRIAEVEAFLKTTTKMMQVQVEVVDRKIESEVGGVKKELTQKVEERGGFLENELKKIEVKAENSEKSLAELKSMDFINKEDFDRFLDELKKVKSLKEGDRDWNLDEIRAFAREIVEKEIEKHAADGLGRVDYAVASGGAMVIRHSEPYVLGSNKWFPKAGNKVHHDAQKMLQPSFGEPGHCFALKGSEGFVEIKLRSPIVPEAITLEHLAKSVAYDRSSAPKECRVSAWLNENAYSPPLDSAGKMILLAEFTYDLDKSNAQTFNVDTAGLGVVSTVRLDFASNYGGPFTCIYRLRVHGHEHDSAALLALQS